MTHENPSTLLMPVAVLFLLAGAYLGGHPHIYLVAIAIGLIEVLITSYRDIRAGSFSLDYIAFVAMVFAVFTENHLAGAVIALMYTSGRSLETYASWRAEASLSSLLARIPKKALVRRASGATEEIPLTKVRSGMTIIVRGGELVPLDGLLVSKQAILNLANLTGESLPETLEEGSVIKSGSVNVGEAFELHVSGTLATSTYAKIVELVRKAEHDQAPFVRLAARANIPFTLITVAISSGVYLLTGDVTRVLAVLVVATPCPLIIAAPVAFIGGLSRGASKNIIIKTPAALEILSRVTTLFFDKTGTLTLGEPKITTIVLKNATVSENDALSLAASLEFHSIHPLARAILSEAHTRGLTPKPATAAREIIGKGMVGELDGKKLVLTQAPDSDHREGSLSLELTINGEPAAIFHLSDVLKENAKKLLTDLSHNGFSVSVLTGDREENARAVFDGFSITTHAGCTPEEKYRVVEEARARGEIVAMIGDGLNDAPALAKAHMGIVFSGTENSASIEAANVAILGHDLDHIRELFRISKRSIRIANESVYVGIILSVIGMGVGAFGVITPVQGAFLQEGIDIAVILNALRAAFPPYPYRRSTQKSSTQAANPV